MSMSDLAHNAIKVNVMLLPEMSIFRYEQLLAALPS
jgi:hypothetical protein